MRIVVGHPDSDNPPAHLLVTRIFSKSTFPAIRIPNLTENLRALGMKQSFIGFGSSKPSKLKFRHVFYSVVGFFCGFIAVRASGLIPSFVVGVGGAGIGSLFGHLWHGYFGRYIETEFAKLESKLIGDELVGGMDGNPPTYDAKLELNTPRIHMAMVSVIECSAITTALILAFENLYFSDLELFSS